MNRLSLIAMVLAASGCGSWAGNPKSSRDKDDGGDKGAPPVPVTASVNLAPGESAYKRITLKAGQTIEAAYTLGTASSSASMALADIAKSQELSVLAPGGREITFDRPKAESVSVPVVAPVDGEYIVAVRNNSNTDVTLNGKESAAEVQPESETGFQAASEATSAIHRDKTFKAALLFSKTCQTENSAYTTAPRNDRETLSGGVKTVRAPEGQYFVQPLVFLGWIKDKAAGTVEPLTQASIKVVAGESSIALSEISQLAADTLGDTGRDGSSAVALEYGGFLGAAGAFYTLPTFRKRGNCDDAPTLPLSTDPGKDTVELVVEDSSVTPSISRRIPIRVTVNGSVETFAYSGVKQTSWDLCSYDQVTGEPFNYSKGSGSCNTISTSNPPSARVDQLPSAIYSGTVTSASDPTRVLFYGRSLSRSFINAIVANKDGNGTANPAVNFQGCLYNGGLVSLPVSREPSVLPINEFNLAVGDIFSLGTRLGSYTALTDFFQGNVAASGTQELTRNLPRSDGSLIWATLKASWTGCSTRADSGVFAAAIADYGIYPGDEGMYGVVEP